MHCKIEEPPEANALINKQYEHSLIRNNIIKTTNERIESSLFSTVQQRNVCKHNNTIITLYNLVLAWPFGRLPVRRIHVHFAHFTTSYIGLCNQYDSFPKRARSQKCRLNYFVYIGKCAKCWAIPHTWGNKSLHNVSLLNLHELDRLPMHFQTEKHYKTIRNC